MNMSHTITSSVSMINTIRLSKYNFGIMILYVLLVPLLIWFMPSSFYYHISYGKLDLLTLFVALFGLFAYIFWKRRGLGIKVVYPSSAIFLIIGYATLIAVAEEMIFRGFIQGFLQSILAPVFAILASSVIFGIAHAFNTASGFHPRAWNWELIAISFAGGIPLGLLFYLTGSLFWPTLTHIVYLVFLYIFIP